MDYDITRIHWYTPKSSTKSYEQGPAYPEGKARKFWAESDLHPCGFSTNQFNGEAFYLFTKDPKAIEKLLKENSPMVERRYSIREWYEKKQGN